MKANNKAILAIISLQNSADEIKAKLTKQLFPIQISISNLLNKSFSHTQSSIIINNLMGSEFAWGFENRSERTILIMLKTTIKDERNN